jgi:hypothetical protein
MRSYDRAPEGYRPPDAGTGRFGSSGFGSAGAGGKALGGFDCAVVPF